MEEVLKTLLLDTNGVVAYATVFGILIACGLGVPLPEDISLILGGYLAHHGAASLPGMMAVGYLGIIIGDSMIFYAGRRVGSRVGAKPGGFFSRIVTPEKRARVQLLFAKHGPKVVMIARFLPGVRAVTYFTAGSAGMSYWRFAMFDSIAALASAPLFVYLGWRFGGELDLLIDKLKRGQVTVIVALVVVAAAYFAFSVWRKRREHRREAALLASAQSLPAIDLNQASGDASSAQQPPAASQPVRPSRTGA